MPKEKILITVKTYPSISAKYDELVCTAGFREDGSWIRIYPVQFRKKSYTEQYKKWQWIEIDVVKNTSDKRPESFRPISHDTPIKICSEIKPDGKSWDERRKIALKKVYTNKIELLRDAKDTNKLTSLAVFKPTEITDFKIEPTEREWKKEKIESLKQMNLFDSAINSKFEVVKKLPYKFSYTFLDDSNESSTLMIEDWEIGQLYWNSLKHNNGNEDLACQAVKKKYFGDFAKTKDLHLFLGSTKLHHFRAPNPFLIIGTPKYITQTTLF